VTRPTLLLLRALAVAAIGAVSWKLLHVDERGAIGAALACVELGALVAALAWPGRLTAVAALALPAAIAITTQEVLLQVAWTMWAVTMIGLANLARGVRAPADLPAARATRAP
jgi:hypothetical protein